MVAAGFASRQGATGCASRQGDHGKHKLVAFDRRGAVAGRSWQAVATSAVRSRSTVARGVGGRRKAVAGHKGVGGHGRKSSAGRAARGQRS